MRHDAGFPISLLIATSLATVLATTVLSARSAAAQEQRPEIVPHHDDVRLVLAFEVAQGALFDDERTGLGWIGSLRLLPGVAFRGLQLNGLLDGVYRNPEGDFGLGARVSHVVVPVLRGAVQVRAAGEGEYLVRAKHARAALGLLGDLSGLLQLGAWLGRDFDQRSFYFLISVGSDPVTYDDPIGAIIGASPMEDEPDGD
jgi:hypothetical protein